MQLTGMGYDGEPEPWTVLNANPEADLRWRSQTIPGKTGIPASKLQSNDQWLVTTREIDEALEAYVNVPAGDRAIMETDTKWLARKHGGFEAE